MERFINLIFFFKKIHNNYLWYFLILTIGAVKNNDISPVEWVERISGANIAFKDYNFLFRQI